MSREDTRDALWAVALTLPMVAAMVAADILGPGLWPQ